MSHTPTLSPVTEKADKPVRLASPSKDERAGAVRSPLAMTFEELLGRNDASSETAEDIIQAVRQWRDVPSSEKPG